MTIKAREITRTAAVLIICVFAVSTKAFSQETSVGEYVVTIEVEPDTVAFPGNELSQIPIRYVRIRSTEIRDILREYDPDRTATMEKVYEYRKVGNNPAEKVEVRNTYVIRFRGLDATQTQLLRQNLETANSAVSVWEKQ